MPFEKEENPRLYGEKKRGGRAETHIENPVFIRGGEQGTAETLARQILLLFRGRKRKEQGRFLIFGRKGLKLNPGGGGKRTNKQTFLFMQTRERKTEGRRRDKTPHFTLTGERSGKRGEARVCALRQRRRDGEHRLAFPIAKEGKGWGPIIAFRGGGEKSGLHRKRAEASRSKSMGGRGGEKPINLPRGEKGEEDGDGDFREGKGKGWGFGNSRIYFS